MDSRDLKIYFFYSLMGAIVALILILLSLFFLDIKEFSDDRNCSLVDKDSLQNFIKNHPNGKKFDLNAYNSSTLEDMDAYCYELIASECSVARAEVDHLYYYKCENGKKNKEVKSDDGRDFEKKVKLLLGSSFLGLMLDENKKIAEQIKQIIRKENLNIIIEREKLDYLLGSNQEDKMTISLVGENNKAVLENLKENKTHTNCLVVHPSIQTMMPSFFYFHDDKRENARQNFSSLINELKSEDMIIVSGLELILEKMKGSQVLGPLSLYIDSYNLSEEGSRIYANEIFEKCIKNNH